MHPRSNERVAPRNPPRADFVAIGFAAVLTAVSFLNMSTVVGGGGEGAAPVVRGIEQWQVILAFALLSAGLLCIMHGMRAPPLVVRRTADAVLWNAGGRGPEWLLPLVILLLCPLLEAWLDFI